MFYYVVVGSACDDDDIIMNKDVCDGQGGCVGMIYICMLGVCDVSSVVNGTDCDVVYHVVGMVCDDVDMVTKDDVCDVQGTCLGVAIVCPKPIMCTLKYVFNGVDCILMHVMVWMKCNDMDFITVDDVCDG